MTSQKRDSHRAPPRLRQTLAISATRGRKNAVWERTACDQFCAPL